MIIIIDEASEKLASFYYHDEIFKLQWRSVAGKASMSRSEEHTSELQSH